MRNEPTTEIVNIAAVAKLNVNIYEIENSILEGESKMKTHDATFFFIELDTPYLMSYKPCRNEVVLFTNKGVSFLVKKI